MSALGHKRTYAVQKGMSASHPKADMCGATRDVCFGPEADIAPYSISSSAGPSSGTPRLSAFAVLRLMVSSSFVACTTGEHRCPTCGGSGFLPYDDDDEEVIRTV